MDALIKQNPSWKLLSKSKLWASVKAKDPSLSKKAFDEWYATRDNVTNELAKVDKPVNVPLGGKASEAKKKSVGATKLTKEGLSDAAKNASKGKKIVETPKTRGQTKAAKPNTRQKK